MVDEIGIGPEAMLKRHPRLIYCSIWAFGYQGPMRMKPGFDPLLQAYGGMMSVTGRPEDPPTFCGASINDKATGMFCTIGALAALRQRDKTGKGCLVDTSLFELGGALGRGQVNSYLASGTVPKRHGTGGAVIVPYQLFDMADRPRSAWRPATTGCGRAARRCWAIPNGRPIRATPRAPRGSHNKAELLPLIAAAMRGQTRAYWLGAFEKAGVPCSPVNDIGELAATEQFAAVDLVQQLPVRAGEGEGPQVVGLPITFDRQRPHSPRSAPKLGEHTEEVLAEMAGQARK